MPFDFRPRYKQAYAENVKKVRRDPSIVSKKISNFCELHSFKREDVEKQIKNNEIVAAVFARDPQRQNFFEKTAAEFIKNIQGITDFELLPKSKFYISSGNLMTKEGLEEGGGRSKAKSIDFCWLYKGNKFYAYHKHSWNTGGSQDNQYSDIQRFIEESRPSRRANRYYVAIADGEFYQGQNGKARITRIENLKQISKGGGERVFACTIDELEAEMKRVIGDK